MKPFSSGLKVAILAAAATGMVATSALATDGMFGNGTGARNKALAGAGVANEKDATAMSLNPAGLVHSENQLNISASLFSPRREYEMMTRGGPVGAESESEWFVIPNIAYSHRVSANTVFGLSMYGNGGMNTDYPVNFANPADPNLGIDLTQIYMSAGLAHSYGNLAIGVAPIVSLQIFSADGLPGMSEDTNIAAGIGLRAGAELALTDSFRIGVAGATPTWSQAFTSYDGPGELFAHTEGELRVPATVQAGVALDLTPTFTVMADYKRIFYSSSKAISTKFNPAPPPGSGGFGWNDINIYKIGVEWDVNPGFTLRAGYSYNDQPLRDDANHFFPNIMTPATVQHHITGGAKFALSDTMDMEVAGMYAPEKSLSTPGSMTTPPTTVKMHQFELTAGIKWKLGN